VFFLVGEAEIVMVSGFRRPDAGRERLAEIHEGGRSAEIEMRIRRHRGSGNRRGRGVAGFGPGETDFACLACRPDFSNRKIVTTVNKIRGPGRAGRCRSDRSEHENGRSSVAVRLAPLKITAPLIKVVDRAGTCA
jgi:hypothetical protein